MTSRLQLVLGRKVFTHVPWAIAVMSILAITTAGWAETQTTPSETLTTKTAAADATPRAGRDSDTTYSIVLAGEKVGVDVESPKKNLPDIVGATTSTLGTDVTDFSKFGLTLAETARLIASAPNIKPDIAIIFGGYTDEVKDVSEDEVKASIRAIASSLKNRNPKMRIFLIPSATYTGTLMNARMRLSAEDNGITFVPLGTEVSGEPFAQAMTAVRAELNKSAPAATAEAPAAQPAHAVTIRGGQVEEAGQGNDPAASMSYEAKQASLQRELNRIAGEASDEPLLPNAADALSTSSFVDGQPKAPADAAQTPLPPGGKVTVKGKEAQQEIQMRPLPALKAYRPQIPVPRNEIDKKEPALSR